MGGASAGRQSVNGGTQEGDIELMGGGANFDRLYHKPKVLLMLSSLLLKFETSQKPPKPAKNHPNQPKTTQTNQKPPKPAKNHPEIIDKQPKTRQTTQKVSQQTVKI